MKAGIPLSGEVTVSKTLMNSPKANVYHAVRADDNVVLEELTPQIANRTNSISGLLIGKNGDLDWHAVGRQLSLTSETNHPVNNEVEGFVGFARSEIRSYFTGIDLHDTVWSGSHVSGNIEGAKVEADLKLNGTTIQLNIKIVQKGENGQCQIDYSK